MASDNSGRIRELAAEYLDWADDVIEVPSWRAIISELITLLQVQNHPQRREFVQIVGALLAGTSSDGDQMCADYLREACVRLRRDAKARFPEFDSIKWDSVQNITTEKN